MMAKVARKSLLAKLPKRARERISRIMQQGDGELPLHEFLAKRWDHESFWHRSMMSTEDNAKLRADRLNMAREQNPQLRDDQVDRFLSIWSLRIGLRESAIARRIVLEDPGEMARGLAIDSRLHQLLLARKHGYDACLLIDRCAIRQIDEAAGWIQGHRAGHDAIVDVGSVLEIGYMSILQKNWKALAVVASRPTDQKETGFVEALYTFLVGVSRRDPALVASGLSDHMLSIKNMRLKDELIDVVNLVAQGLYRLAHWVAPDLVSEFDIEQDRPWDAEFHRWCDEHPDPLADFDLSAVSPEMHNLLNENQRPEWLPIEREPTWEILLSELGKQTNRERGMTTYRKELAGLLQDGPVVTHWNLQRNNAEHRCQQMAGVGGRTEIRPTSGTSYRLFSLKRNKVTEWGP